MSEKTEMKSPEQKVSENAELIRKWEHRIASFRAIAGEAEISCHKKGLDEVTQQFREMALKHYEGCIRQIEGCINELKAIGREPQNADTQRLDWLDKQREAISDFSGEILMAYRWEIEAQNYCIREAIDAARGAEISGSETLPAQSEVTRYGQACPCLHTTPCRPDCTCVKPMMSCGCLRCCTYGSKEQQRSAAERLAKIIDAGNEALISTPSKTPTLPQEKKEVL